MKRFIFKLAVLLLIVAGFDCIAGLGFSYITNHINVGGQGRDNYICNEAVEDILIFGSSRAVHHYNAKMLEDSLGMTCYNCGDDGNGIILSYGRLLMAKERHQPKLIIHDVATAFDLFKNDNHKYLGWLRARYERKGIAEIFYTIDSTERFKMCSHLYRNNSKFLQNLFTYATSVSNNTGVKGFRPLKGELDPMKIKQRRNEPYEFDTLKLEFFNKFVDASESSQLVFVSSPMWYGIEEKKLSPIRDLCLREGIPFIDFSNDPKYVRNDKYFKDGSHLNACGADEFTQDLIMKLRNLYKE